MNLSDETRYKYREAKKWIDKKLSKVTPKFVSKVGNKVADLAGVNKNRERYLKSKVIRGKATLEDKLEYRRLLRGSNQMGFQGVTTAASKVALATVPVTGVIGGGVSAGISSLSTAALGKHIYDNNKYKSKSIANKMDHELSPIEKAKRDKALKLATKISDPKRVLAEKLRLKKERDTNNKMALIKSREDQKKRDNLAKATDEYNRKNPHIAVMKLIDKHVNKK